MTRMTHLFLIAAAAVIGAAIALAVPLPKFAPASSGTTMTAAGCACPGGATPTTGEMTAFPSRI